MRAQQANPVCVAVHSCHSLLLMAVYVADGVTGVINDVV